MQLVLDALAPAERAAFVLHDVFGYPFDEVSAVMGRSGTAVRQLASRARRKVQGVPEPVASQAARAESQRVVDAFLTAARGGDLATRCPSRVPDAVMRSDLVGQQMGTDREIQRSRRRGSASLNGTRGQRLSRSMGNSAPPGSTPVRSRWPSCSMSMQASVCEVELIADPDVLTTMDVVRVRRSSRA